MDVNLRKTATDTAYVVVGVGVLGFQQAQVKRRDAVARVSSIRQDARSSLAHQTDSIKARATGCAASLGDLGTTVTGTVGNLGSTVTGTVGSTVGSTDRSGRHPGEGRRRAPLAAPTRGSGPSRSSATSGSGSSP